MAATLSVSLAAAEFDLDLVELGEISPRPGTVISSDNFERFSYLFDPDFGKFIQGGFVHITVGQPVSFNPHPAFVFATKQYRGQPALTDNPGLLTNFVQGKPFPGRHDIKDPKAGTKVAWNMRYAYTGDNGKIPEMHWQLRDWRKEDPQFEMFTTARTMRFMYRHVREPIPYVKKNPQDAYGAFLLNVIDAGTYDGAQALVFANRDESRDINGWVWIPQLSRTQSLASFAREESMFGSDILPTDFLVFATRMVDMDWEYRGSTYMLLPFYRHDRVETANRKARKYDYWHADLHGRSGCFPKVNWQLREVLILEARTKDQSAPAARRILYIDKQTSVLSFWKIYKENEALWKFAISGYAHPNSHVMENNESGAPILTVYSTIDAQTNRCTTMQLLTVVNVNDVTTDDFDTSNIRSGGGRSFRRR